MSKKGSKALLVWGSPRKYEVDKEASTDEKEYSFFPVCYLFSEQHVEKSNNLEGIKDETAG